MKFSIFETEFGEKVIEVPAELLKQMGWCEQTLLEWMIDEETLVLGKDNGNAR